ncbi:NFACT RNA binding domain-containing protein [Weissella cibaria]|uniref:NFACT RNA binding domain-containing protein n=1 Tax=Weissella cibaria TaxID=137591 RepID=UPI00143F40D7|nr:NFACT RNA binding domain-containing protein [Weissella cibaria]NKN30782.1 fibronectin/fibrinogen-binding protein [Weissella cibaria]NKN79668.1 fibronectin/fibrinogen-binding protein [Weissella cibaria]NKN97818.1 fibronectin/fibrinogen-binding protein [Weissella cibaria]NKN99957.1 fibronectin/fibrinogen-binding protein [Weissella cibaria]
MSFDGLFTHAMVRELNETLAGGRIMKIHQPYPNEIFLVIRNNRTNYPVLLSAHPSFARAQISRIKYANPQTAPNFAMMLRKHLEGAQLLRVEQVANDRMIKFTTSGRNELGDEEKTSLILEMMGRHSNLFLIDEPTQRILDLIKHVPADQNRVRTLMPGGTYVMPPKQDVINPYESLDGLANLILDNPDVNNLAKGIQTTFQGFARDSAQELAAVLQQSGDAMKLAQNWFDRFDQPEPRLISTEKGVNFTPFEWLTVQGNVLTYPTLSEMLDAYFAEKSERDRVQQQAAIVLRVVRNELKKNKTKIKKQQAELDAADNADEFKVKGELLTTYMHQVERGMTEIELPNYYDDNKPLKIALSNQIGPSQNAQKYFTKYNKLKTSVKYLNEQIAMAQEEVDYFENLLAQIDIASPKDIEEIRQELIQEGYMRVQSKKKQKPQVSQPEKFYATDGTLIEVGKNNLQNERLSMKTAAKSDIWLHTKDIPGSHVIIHDANPSDDTLLEGAMLAAYFSKARDSANVPVDYLPVRRLRKPNGSKPGFVIFEGQTTMAVTPDFALVQRLRQNKPAQQ